MKAHIHIKFSANNIIINFTDENGNCIKCLSAGALGFKGSKKVSLLAATATADEISKKVVEHDIKQVIVFFKGPETYYKEIIEVFKKRKLTIITGK